METWNDNENKTETMYDRFAFLCKQHGVRPIAVSKATGVSTATFTGWKKGAYTPKPDKLLLIAKYFGVPLSFLMFGEKGLYEQARITDEQKECFDKIMRLPQEKQKLVFAMVDTLCKDI